jgi:hypothetical protein
MTDIEKYWELVEKLKKIKAEYEKKRNKNKVIVKDNKSFDIDDKYCGKIRLLKAIFSYSDSNEYGVSINQISKWCRDHKVVMYAFNMDYNLIHKVTKFYENNIELKPRKDYKVLMFIIHNNHMYLISENIKSLAHKNGTCTELTKHNKKIKEVKPFIDAEGKLLKPFKVYENIKDTLEFYAKTVYQSGYLPENVIFDGQNIIRFELKGITYFINSKAELCIYICKKLKIPFTGQCFTTLILHIGKQLNYDVPKSKYNKETFNVFMMEGGKDYDHFGVLPSLTIDEANKLAK